MAARKLQSEIDRTLKKVAEGVELFESIYDKMKASTNQTQKEKLETDLKTQIKRLQRLRDQIKSWVASSDIKDKSILLDNRKLIETQMEKFKACEKEMKTKAFSKEGLTAALKLDPKAQEKNDTIAWLQTMVDDLSIQVESAEAEVETLQGGAKKKGKGGTANERLESLEQLNDRRKWHISRLELILRLIENGSLQTDKVLALKEDVKYFVESNTEEDFDEDEGIYDDLNLEEQEGRFGIGIEEGASEDESISVSENLPPRTPLKDVLRKPSHEDEEHKKDEAASPVMKKATAAVRKQSNAETTRPILTAANFAQQPMSTVVKANIPGAPRVPAPAHPMRYSAAAAAGSNPAIPVGIQQSAAGSSITTITNGPATTTTSASNPSNTSAASALPTASSPEPSMNPPSPSLTHPTMSAVSPILSSSGMPTHSHASRHTPPPDSDNFDSRNASPILSEGEPAATSSPHRELDGVTVPMDLSHSPPSNGLDLSKRQTVANGSLPSFPQARQPSPIPPVELTAYPASTVTPPTDVPSISPPGVMKPNFSADNFLAQEPSRADLDRDDRARLSHLHENAQRGLSESSQHQSLSNQSLSNSLSDLLISFESAKQKAATRMSDLNHVHKLLEAGYSNIPQPRDTAKPKYYVPRHPYQTPSYYPQTPHPILSSPAVFSQIDVETLFYIFYFLPGTYQQFLAAKELKKQSWRFHVKYLTWFQRHSEPQAITEEYEQGVYVYFDWEGSWCQRKKADFRFEYRYLSEE